MKKFLCLLLTITVMLGCFAACSGGKQTSASENENAESTAQIVEESEAASEAPAAEPTISATLDSFEARTLGGGSFSPEDFSAYELTVINFWGTYCGPCISEMPDLEQFNKSKPENVNFITFCTDGADNEQSAQSIVEDAGLTAPVIVAADGDFAEILSQIQYIPTTVFADSHGKIVGTEIIGIQPNVVASLNAHVQEILGS